MNKPMVSCQILGQLGNQLFILSTALSYSWDYDATAIFPELHNTNYRIAYNREKLFFRLDASTPSRPFQKEYWQKYWFVADPIPYCPEDLYLFGYFQSWKHFHRYREKLLSVFAPKDDTVEYLDKKYPELMAHPLTVSVHVRTNCKRTHEFAPFIGLKFLKEAMVLFPSDAKFVIFSDRINWCKRHFLPSERELVFIEGNDAVEDLILMSRCKHHIIANSTFSWWGAYLNQSPDKRVIAPAFTSVGAPIENYYLPEWTLLPVVIEPYPEDMYCYDTVSQSLDNN